LTERVEPKIPCCKKPALRRILAGSKEYWYCENCWKQFSKAQLIFTKGNRDEILKIDNR